MIPAHRMQGMIFVPGGTFRMGSDRHYPEERPERLAAVDGFWIDRTPVTNEGFRKFVDATGYVTDAERAGSIVFTPPAHPVALDDWRRWWTLRDDANWRAPYGPNASLADLERHPVVHVTFADALAYAQWLGKDLPTEAEWEFAAREGLDGAEFAWGDEFMPNGRPMANTWHGAFPYRNDATDGFTRTSPVGSFPENAYGLADMIGNVWEWTRDVYAQTHTAAKPHACCTRHDDDIAKRVIKGGSHLCAPSYCRRYRPAARQGQPIDSSTSHIGFRCVLSGTALLARVG